MQQGVGHPRGALSRAASHDPGPPGEASSSHRATEVQPGHALTATLLLPGTLPLMHSLPRAPIQHHPSSITTPCPPPQSPSSFPYSPSTVILLRDHYQGRLGQSVLQPVPWASALAWTPRSDGRGSVRDAQAGLAVPGQRWGLGAFGRRGGRDPVSRWDRLAPGSACSWHRCPCLCHSLSWAKHSGLCPPC